MTLPTAAKGMYALTERQREVLAYLRERDACPSYEEIAAALGLKNKSGVHRIIVGLEERGAIRRLPHRARAIEVLDKGSDLGSLPAPRHARQATGPDVIELPVYSRDRINWLPEKRRA